VSSVRCQVPETPLPLIDADEHVPLPLHAAYAAIYRARRFRVRLDYHADPEPPLTIEQRSTVQRLLRDAAIR